MSEERGHSPEEGAVRRGRGRPKGSLNKKTMLKQAAIREPESEPEIPDPGHETTEEEEAAPPPPSEEEAEEAAPPEVEVVEPPKPKQRRKQQKRPRAEPTPEAEAEPSQPQLTYLQVLQRGLAAARVAQRNERVQRYDAYFSHL